MRQEKCGHIWAVLRIRMEKMQMRIKDEKILDVDADLCLY
jgi:hypothetical protein